MQDNCYAIAKSDRNIDVVLSKSISPFKLKKFRFYEEHERKFMIECTSVTEFPTSYSYHLVIDDFEFVPGRFYQIATEQNYFIPIDISFLALTEKFEKKYRYDGRLGPSYSKEETTLRVFSPFSHEISLHIKKADSDVWEIYSMHHDYDNGVFSVTLQGDYDGAAYLFERFMYGKSLVVIDPYSLSLSSNSRWSYIINPDRVKAIKSNNNCLKPFTDRMKAIIYECSVRDMTSRTDVLNKGTFKALYTPNLKTKDGQPIGIDYLSSLGVSHVQLLPVMDFQTVDEDDSSSMYNWGYDPLSYFSPEGSYASDVHDPYSRVLELKTLVSSLHERGIRVVLDVVYNHVFSTLQNALNILCPQYYYRHDANGNLSNGTGCGNDLESRNYMVRKLIIDSLVTFLDLYDIDGYRFDLMGILDCETISLAYKALTKKKKNILYYGEGWDLGTAMPQEEKANYYNAYKMPFASFFNDRFRDVAKGKSGEYELSVRGYLLGDTNYRDGFKHVLLGSIVPLAFNPMFEHPGQSINYVECHDNHTLFDKIRFACGEDSLKEMQERIKLNIFATLISAGIPFFHQGEEIGGTKKGIGNSYNSSDEINGFDYNLLSSNHDLYEFFIDAIKFKKEYLYFTEKEFENLLKDNKIKFEDLDNGALKIEYEYQGNVIYVIFNPSKETIMYDFPYYVKLIFSNSGLIPQDVGFFIHMAIVNQLSVSVFLEKKEEMKIK